MCKLVENLYFIIRKVSRRLRRWGEEHIIRMFKMGLKTLHRFLQSSKLLGIVVLVFHGGKVDARSLGICIPEEFSVF